MLSDFITNRLGTKNFCACIDLGHAALTGCEPYEFIDKMAKGVIGALHVQDNDYKADRHIPPFHGNLDWAKITESLKNYGYNGEINFEVTFSNETKNEDELMHLVGEFNNYILHLENHKGA